MIGYAMFGSNDLDRAKAFYDDLFATAGIGTMMDFPRGGRAWGTGWDAPMFGLDKPFDGQPATVGNGAMIAIQCDSRPKVDVLHAKALELGAANEGDPGVRGPEGDQAFYAAYFRAAYFRDLDGNKLNLFCVGGA